MEKSIVNSDERNSTINDRNWVPCESESGNINSIITDGNNASFNLRACTYNILGQSLIPKSLGLKEDQIKNYKYLKLEYRIKQIINQLKKLDCDFLCIQEIEKETALLEAIVGLGYNVHSYFF